MIPTISVRWNLGICQKFGNNLAKMCSLAELNRPKLDICTNLQKRHCNGEQNILVEMELLNNSHHIRELDFGDLPQIWK